MAERSPSRKYWATIPLEQGLFDLVIIDEASQVSIAQALPAIIRAKKVLVLGDRNQFGNAKTSNASKEVNGLHQVAIEYDGFEFHFAKGIPSGLINSTTWRAYLTADDLEREKVLESFGVPMIRLNRFNLGENPVTTIDALLRERLEAMLNGRGLHDVVAKTAERAGKIEEGLKTGEYRRCKKCDRDLPVEMFQDNNTKSGLGRFCRACKSHSPGLDKPRFRRRHKRW